MMPFTVRRQAHSHANKAARANRLPALLSAKRTAEFGSAFRVVRGAVQCGFLITPGRFRICGRYYL